MKSWGAFIFFGLLLGGSVLAETFNIEAAAKYLESRNGHALLVYHQGELIFEEYYNGHTARRGHRLASGTKSFSGVLAVIAEGEGIIDLDERVSDTITEWKDDKRLSRITIRQLITLSSGIDGGDNGSVPSGKKAVAMATAKGKPGTSFSYAPIPFQVWGELMKRKLSPQDESVEAYLKRKLLDPIGLTIEFWRKDDDGAIQFPSGAFVTAREWAKFGLLVLEGGMRNGEQIVSKNALQQCFFGTKANPNYGLTFWLNSSGRHVAPEDMVMAAGKGKQKLYIIPSQELLIVQLAEAQGYNEQAFLERFFSQPGTTFNDREGDRRNAIASDPDSNTNRAGIGARLREMDINGDEQLTKEEAKGWEPFDEVDADNDGIATGQEIRTYLQAQRRQ